MMKAAAIVFLVCFWFVNFSAAQIESIEIVSKWGGLGKQEASVLVVSRKSDKYYFADGHEVPNELLTAVERAIDEPQITALNFDNLGITQAWLDQNAAPAFPECCNYDGIWVTAQQKLLFNQIFRDRAQMEKIITDYLSGGARTDDYPRVEATIKRRAETIKLSTARQAPLMLPWEIESAGKRKVTYNADISRALVNLLPADFTNRDRLSGATLRPDVSVKVIDEVFKAQRKIVKKRK